MDKIPEVKKKLHSFFVSEEGKISKKSLIRTGTILSSLALGSAIAQAGTSHTNEFSAGEQGEGVEASHGHHAAHSNHSNHSSHSNGGGGK